jgi:hypothetical protein
MARRSMALDGGYVGTLIDQRTLVRLEKAAPSASGARSEFLRRAIVRELDRLERAAEPDHDGAHA